MSQRFAVARAALLGLVRARRAASSAVSSARPDLRLGRGLPCGCWGSCVCRSPWNESAAQKSLRVLSAEAFFSDGREGVTLPGFEPGRWLSRRVPRRPVLTRAVPFPTSAQGPAASQRPVSCRRVPFQTRALGEQGGNKTGGAHFAIEPGVVSTMVESFTQSVEGV